MSPNNKPDLIGIGLSTFDVLLRLTELPAWDRRVPIDDITFDGGGPCATALCAASRLGARASFIGTAGNDWFASAKLESMTHHGVDIEHVVYRDKKENQLVCVTVDAHSGERVFNTTKTFYQNPLLVGEVDRSFITQADTLLLDGHYLPTALCAARWMRTAGKCVVLDGSKTSAAQLAPGIVQLVALTDILICGDGYAQALTGIRDLQQAGEASLAYGPKIVVITAGEQGSYTFTTETSFHTPAFEVDVVDTTGAGDVFHGAYIVGLLKGWSHQKIAVFASAVSAIVCTFLGGRSGIPNYSRVLDFLRERGVFLQ